MLSAEADGFRLRRSPAARASRRVRSPQSHRRTARGGILKMQASVQSVARDRPVTAHIFPH